MRRYHSEIFQKTGCTRACFFIGSLGAVVTCAASYLTYTSLHESLEYHSSISIVNTIQSGCDAIGNVIYDLNRYSSSNANKDLGATTSSFSFDPLVYGSFAGNKLEAHSSSLKLRSSQRKYLTSVLQSLDNKKSGESSYKNKPRSSEDHRCLFSNRRLEISELALSYLIHQIPKNVSGLPKDSILISTRNHGRLFFTLFDPVSLLGFDKKRATYINKIEKFKPFSIEPSYFFSVRNTNILKDSSFLAQSGDAKVEPELKFFSEVIFGNGILSQISFVDHHFLEKTPKRIAGIIFIVGILSSAFGVFMTRSALVKENMISRELEEQALTDPVTGIANRRRWDQLILSEDSYRQRTGTSYAVSVIDLDGFKQVNDNFGHSEGDKILAKLAQTLLSVIRSSDTVARVGGDEFVVLFKNPKPSSLARLQSSLEEGLDAQGIEASIGTASTYEVDSLMEAWKLADDRMYRNKSSIRDD